MSYNHLHASPAFLIKRAMFFLLAFAVIPSLVCSSYSRERNVENTLGGTRAVCTSDFDRQKMPLPQPLPKGANSASLNTSPAESSRKLLETFSVQSNEFCTCTCTCNLENICATPTYQPTSNPTAKPPLGGPLDITFQPTSSPTSQPTSLPSSHSTLCPTMEMTPVTLCPTTKPPLGGPLDITFQPTSSPTSQPTCPACTLDKSGPSPPVSVSTSNPTIVNPFSIGVVAPEISGLQ